MFRRSTEFTQYKFLVDGLTNETIKKRVETSLRFYITRANRYRRWNSFLGLSGIVLPAIATFSSAAANIYEKQYPALGMAVPVITLLATITAGVSAHFKFFAKMENYRDLAENMKSEVTLYECGAQKYSREKIQSEEQALDIFAQSLEKIIEDGYRKCRELEEPEKSVAKNRG